MKQEEKKQFWTKKFIITLIVLITILISIILSFTFYFGKNVNDNNMIIHLGNKEYVYSEKELNTFLVKYKKENDYSSIYPNFNTLEEGEDDGSDDTDTSSPDVYTYNTAAEENAAIILKTFLQSSLTGESFIKEADDTTTINEGSILNPTEDNKWIESEYINTNGYNYDTYYQLTDKFAAIKLFNDTTLPTSEDMYQYLEAFSTKYRDMIKISGINDFVTTIFPKNVWDVENYYIENGDTDSYQQLLSFLNDTIEYQTEIAKALFVYSYLWQKDSKADFDYYLTEEMYFDRPMFIWNIEYDNISKANQPTTEITLDNWNSIYDKTYVNEDNTKTNFLDEINKDYAKSYLSNDEEALRGFNGVVSVANSELVVSSIFTDFNQYYNYKYDVNDNNGEELVSLITDDLDKGNQFAKLNIYNPNYFYSAEDEPWKTTADGTVVKIKVEDDVPDDGEDTVSSQNLSALPSDIGKYTGYSYIYYPIFPFPFAKNYHEDNQNIQQYFYQIKVIDNGDGTYSPYDSAKDDQSVLLFDVLFDQYENEGSNSLNYGREEIVYYIVYSIYTNNKDNLLSDAYRYWNSKGFYIVLQGDLEDQYSSLLPQEIQRDE
ncbi:hypothetical protein X271_00482 [Candidatus Hepatoplasma crinochetorum Av]|uniref:Uncharacterized protein n=1 Tax=Candidatus Hepatoplasma crinochetorum Av TaxID=1427984 RepID=W8GK17_9MOLU|nr:hypothetical protein [Candidatus Hepatoplasma crinochetorum]AHK22587.1 hypothetical protein X271_00482 [Candidatus Hepatoplasma crinochetorum Av]